MNTANMGLSLLILVGYFLPAMVACLRHHRNELAIGVLNLVAGWTVVGWIVALVWACPTDVEEHRQRWSTPVALACLFLIVMLLSSQMIPLV
jgi:hypothetical protein